MWNSNKCSACGTSNRKEANRCKQCGADLRSQREPQMKGNAVQLRDDEFAAHIHIDDLEGFFAKSPLVVLPGQQALIYQREKYQGVVGQGEYPLETLLGQINKLGRHEPMRAIICRTDELALTFGLDKLPTAEYLEVSIQISLGLRISDPDLFADLMNNRRVLTTTDLRLLIKPRLEQVLAEFVRGRSIKELQADADLRSHIDHAVNALLGAWLGEKGLALGGVHTLAVGHARYDDQQRKQGEAWLAVEQGRADLAQAKQLDELYSEQEWQRIERLETGQQIQARMRELELNQEEQQFGDRLRRLDLLEKILKADSREAALKQGAEEELAILEQQALKEKLGRENERLDWQQTRELAAIARQAELARAQLDLERTRAEGRATLDHDLKLRRLRQELEIARLQEDESHRQEARRIEAEIAEQERQREQALKQVEHDILIAQKQRQAQIDEDEYQRIRRLKDAQVDVQIQKDQLALEAERTRMEMEKEDREWERGGEHMERLMKLHEARKRQKHEQKLEADDAAARHERERIEAMGKLDADALIALSSAEQGQIIAGLQRTRIMAGMSEEQIMAMVAEHSPQVAEALMERYRNSDQSRMSEGERKLYEQLMEQKNVEISGLKEVMNNSQQAQSELVDKFLSAMQNMGQNQGAAPNMVFVNPATGEATPMQGGMAGYQPAQQPVATEKVLICPGCRAHNALDARFCDNCGNALA